MEGILPACCQRYTLSRLLTGIFIFLTRSNTSTSYGIRNTKC